MTYGFDDCLKYSRGDSETNDLTILKNKIIGCLSVEKTSIEIDKKGIDYIATLRNGATVKIDAKTRKKGCKAQWKTNEPELALEIWSVIGKKTGWTLDEKKEVDLILYTFNKTDTLNFYILPFQQLRIAFSRNCNEWKTDYKPRKQNSCRKGNTWVSECMFVPAKVVIEAIMAEMVHEFDIATV